MCARPATTSPTTSPSCNSRWPGCRPSRSAPPSTASEPVWAIGTGRVASAADAQEVCAAIREELGKLASPELAAGARILYGGSVNAKNVGEIVAPEAGGG